MAKDDEREEGQGRGNFGNPRQHAEAGRQSSGNRGNPQQHAEAGRKGGQSSGGGNRGRGDDDFDAEQEGSGGGVMQAEVEQIDEVTAMSLEELERVTEKLRKDRQTHLAAARAIDEKLGEFRERLDEMLEDDGQGGEEEESGRSQGRQGGRGRGNFGRPQQHARAGRQSGGGKQGRGNGGQGGNGKGRGGQRGTRENSGTAIIEQLLRDNDGEMDSSDLAKQASDKGVKYPHSSYQSLKKRGKIELADHKVRLIEE